MCETYKWKYKKCAKLQMTQICPDPTTLVWYFTLLFLNENLPNTDAVAVVTTMHIEFETKFDLSVIPRVELDGFEDLSSFNSGRKTKDKKFNFIW